MTPGELPYAIGLCPDPSHAAEFYMPLTEEDVAKSHMRRCPLDCPHELVIYRQAQVETEGDQPQDFSCAIEQHPPRDGQSTRCAEQCPSCRKWNSAQSENRASLPRGDLADSITRAG